MTAGIYVIQCVPTGKLYVGSSKDMAYRWSQHRDFLMRGYHANIHLQRAWNKYGEAAFEFKVLLNTSEVSPENLVIAERDAIRLLQPEFNVIQDPTLPPSLDPVVRDKISKALKGRVFTDEWRARMSAAQKRIRPKRPGKSPQQRWLERVVDHVPCGCGCCQIVEVKQHQTHPSYIRRAGAIRYIRGHRGRYHGKAA